MGSPTSLAKFIRGLWLPPARLEIFNKGILALGSIEFKSDELLYRSLNIPVFKSSSTFTVILNAGVVEIPPEKRTSG
jgi:hypothetical protein